MGVQIQGDTGNVVATKGTYSGNVTIGGTLTYEDVTNIDSVGLITARQGIEVGSGVGVAASISVDGNAEFAGIVTATQFVGNGANLTGVASTENIRTNTNATFLQNVNVSGSTTTGSVKLTNSDTALNQHSVGIGTTTTSGKLAGVGTAAGTMVFNSTTSKLEVFNGTRWAVLSLVTETNFAVSYLVIGGGGAGGGNYRGGGGGAGALRTNWNSENQGGGQSSGAAKTLSRSTSYSLIIGAKGTGQANTTGNNGGQTTFDDIVSKGGGGGG